jgi:hypothetical protein
VTSSQIEFMLEASTAPTDSSNVSISLSTDGLRNLKILVQIVLDCAGHLQSFDVSSSSRRSMRMMLPSKQFKHRSTGAFWINLIGETLGILDLNSDPCL